MIVYVVERVVRHEGTDVLAIFDTLDKANDCVRSSSKEYRKTNSDRHEEVKPTGVVRVTVSDVHWTTIPWEVK